MGGKFYRRSEHKTPFVPAVSAASANDHGHPIHIKLHVVRGITSETTSKWAKANLEPGTSAHSDGLGCFIAEVDAGCLHFPMAAGSRKPRDLPSFKWNNTVPGNLTTTPAGAYHALKRRKYAKRYLAGFASKFNCRFKLEGLVESLIVDVVRPKPIGEKTVSSHAEARF